MLKESKNPIWRERIIRYAPLILWIGVIFFLSSTQGSMSKTSYFVRPILLFFFPDAPEERLVIYHSYVRKFAHFFEYAVLAFFSFRAFSTRKFLPNLRFPVSLLLIFTIASLDEFNQSFLSSRTSSFRDVLLDTFGGLVMLSILFLFTKLQSD
ncbi:MAG: VanZ family protein [Pyrinomonadaceae bacterium]